MTTSLKCMAAAAALGITLYAMPASAASVGAPHLATAPSGLTLAHYDGGWRDRPWWRNRAYGFGWPHRQWRRDRHRRWDDSSDYRRRDLSDGYRRHYYGRWNRY